jgi:hypothetical protein
MNWGYPRHEIKSFRRGPARRNILPAPGAMPDAEQQEWGEEAVWKDLS